MGAHLDALDRLYKQCLRMDELYGAFAKKYGESYFSLWALDELGRRPDGISHKQLAETLHLPKQTVASIIASFERRGLTVSEQSPTDRRSRIVRLTGEGRMRAEEVIREMNEIEDASATVVGEEPLNEAADTFGQLIDAVAEEMARHNVPVRG